MVVILSRERWVKSQQSLWSMGKTAPDPTPAVVLTVPKGDDSTAMSDLTNLINIPNVDIEWYGSNPMVHQVFNTILMSHRQRTWWSSN